MTTKWIDNLTIGSFFDRQAGEMPDQKILISQQGTFTFKNLKDISDRLALRMLDWGIKPSDHVAVWAHNIPEWEYLFLALSKIGAIIVPINPNVRCNDLHYDLGTADVDYIFFIDNINGTDYVEILREAVPDLEAGPEGRVQSKTFPRLKGVVTIGNSRIGTFAHFPAFLDQTPQSRPSDLLRIQERLSAFDPYVIKFTCGLTGYGRGSMLTHFGLINNSFSIAEKQNLGPADTICMPLPFHYIFGFWLGIVVSYCTFTPIVIMPRYSAVEVLRLIQDEKCTSLYGVPTMFADIFNHKSFSEFDLSSLRTGIIAGSHCPPDLVQKTFEEMPIPQLTQAYGITEIGILSQTSWDDDREKTIHTTGAPMQGMEMKIIEPLSGKELPDDVQGEICVRGPLIMTGYYKMPDETAELIDQEGWFHTGDLGIRDSDGCYRITGRRRNMIIRGGENIYPMEVEKHLKTFFGISDVRVVGVPSRRLGEEVFAYVKNTNGSACTTQSIREYFKPRIPRHYIPRWVKVVDNFNGLDNQQMDRNTLRQQAMEELHVRIDDHPLEIIYEN